MGTPKTTTVVLGVSGGIAAVKVPGLITDLQKAGHSVKCVMTPGAEQFVTPLSLATLSGYPVETRIFDKAAYSMPHISLSKEANLYVIVPATASILARCAMGESEDLVSLIYLSTTASVLFVPSMHDTMWRHPATQTNVEILKKRGAHFLFPEKGRLADGSIAEGRMVDSTEIFNKIQELLTSHS